MTKWQHELDIAISVAHLAAETALAMQDGIVAKPKADGSPVTAADRKCEEIIVSALQAAFPGDGFLGEEGASIESQNGRRWIVDPIDGTRDYLRGIPLWANLIALEADGEVVAGVVNLAALGATYIASRGGGAFRNGEAIRASNKTSFDESVLCINGLNKVNKLPFRDTLLQRISEFWAVRCLGGALDAMLVASGRTEVWIEQSAAPWDLAPLKVIIEEAGGRLFSFSGESTIYAGHCVACAPGLDAEVRSLIGSK